MHTFYEPSTLVGVSELRTHLDDILKLSKKSRVFLGKRQRPVAVLIPMEEFEHMEALLEKVEDAVLGYMAQERDKKSSLKDYLTLDQVEKKVGLK